MSHLFRRRRKALGALFVSCALLVPTVELAAPGAASAAGYPDVAAEPVPFGGAASFGSLAGVQLNARVVGMASTPDGNGYWLVAADGGVFSFGDAIPNGSMGGHSLSAPVVGMAPTPDGKGYWLVASDGGVFAFGDAHFMGSMGAVHLDQPVVGMASTPDGLGYWLVAADGGIFAFGDAGFFRSMGGQRLNAPVVGMAPTHDGKGYWLVASDGGVFAFGDARFSGSTGAVHLSSPIIGMAATPSGNGYWLVGADGGVFTFGDAGFFGSMGAQQLQDPITAIAARPDGTGYWLLPTAPSLSATLGPGSTGPAVLALQQRLTALGYWLGTPDGTFGDSTEQAVYALEKAAGIGRTGIVGSAADAALTDGVLPRPRSTSGYVIEVDLEDDLVMFVTNGRVDFVLNTSTGGGYTYTEAGVTAVADTPVGHFQIYRDVDGLVVDSLGALWRPRFFDAGFAIHGDSSVPPEPVSHGCVRVSNEAIDWIWSANLAPIGTAVWVY
ncbi:MAG TPA: L,D-transpeptidase family protein [Acidimicrobiales bacterium]|nr:L,D-transpeptidase family protein [Acidimicrobiales bacterium]